MSDLSTLSLAATTAIWRYVEIAGEHDHDPAFGNTARLHTLVIALVDAGGTRHDLDQLAELGEPALAFLNRWHAATVWAAYAPMSTLIQEAEHAA